MRPRPLLIYDGDCKFCRQWISRWRHVTGNRVEYAPFQEVGGQFPEIPRERFDRSIQFVEPGRGVTEGARAVFRALARNPRHRRPLWMYEHLPGAAPLCEWVYRRVARHRHGLWSLTRLLWGEWAERPTYFLTRAVFLRCLGIVYAVAFASLMVQVAGLVGGNGILPAEEYLRRIAEQLGPVRFWFFPTVFWVNATDGFLKFVCAIGTAGGAALLLGWFRPALLFLLWMLYLSLMTAGQIFLGYQWDTLLLETGFLAIFLAPAYRRSDGTPQPPSLMMLWLGRLLLFKLMFSSGFGKLAGGDPTWHNLTALAYHYETQPLPTWVAWYAHQLPLAFHQASAAAMFFVQLAAPFLIFAPRRARHVGCALLVIFQGLIALTGNYTFFNFLTTALCVLLLDDGFLRRFWPGGKTARPGDIAFRSRGEPFLGRVRVGLVAAVVLLLSLFQISGLLEGRVRAPPAVLRAMDWLQPLHLVNRYGLFTIMTTSRPEIIVEGSNDLDTWKEYEFKWKPGDVKRAPGFVAPHQPRLDWQMWFAAFSSYERDAWVVGFLVRLLEGSRPALDLLGKNPFPAAPPRYIRAWLYDYRFTDSAARQKSGAWWRRQRLQPYTPVFHLPDSL
ncbi:MAG: lipase maturation factor family protein [Nitrospinales bacterium]